MRDNIFFEEYLCLCEPTEKDRYLYAISKEYHDRTEMYDRSICTGIIKNGSIMPATNREFVLINRNALAVKKELQERAYRERGIGPERVNRAIRDYLTS